MYTLADLVRLTRAKRRSVQLWAESGALVAEPETERAGAGVHRAFSRDEAIVACVVAAFALDAFPIGKLIHIGASIRDLLKKKEFRGDVLQAVNNERPTFLYYDQKLSPTIIAPFVEQFGKHLLGEMNDENVKANIVYLNGCFARLRSQSF
jgi:hypothetical protein